MKFPPPAPPPPPPWQLQEKRICKKQKKKKLHLHKRRHAFFPAVLRDVSNGSLTDQIFVSFSFSIWSLAHKKKAFFANLHQGGGSGAERGLGGNSFGFVDARETSFLAQSDKKGRPLEQTMFQINRRLIFAAKAGASLPAEPQLVINQHPSSGSRWGRWRWRSAVHSATFYLYFFYHRGHFGTSKREGAHINQSKLINSITNLVHGVSGTQ